MNKQLITSLTLGSAVALGAISTSLQADTNPFAASPLNGGYELAQVEGKCGEGKCGGAKSTDEGKCGEGKCGGDKASSEGKCGEGKCGGKAESEGKCGEGKCGGNA